MKRREHLVGNLRSAAPALPSMLTSEWLASIWRSTEMSALRGRAGPELAARAIIFRVRREALSDFHVDCLVQSIAIHVCAQFAVARRALCKRQRQRSRLSLAQQPSQCARDSYCQRHQHCARFRAARRESAGKAGDRIFAIWDHRYASQHFCCELSIHDFQSYITSLHVHIRPFWRGKIDS